MHRHPLRQALRLPQAALKRVVSGLLQLVLLAYRPTRLARSGFVLPTTVLLTLMVVLTATALTYRSFTRTDMAISQRDQQVITNAASPAIDRAKAKIEFLFRTDPRFPSGVPGSDVLADLMLPNLDPPNVTFAGFRGTVPIATGNNPDPYTLPGETRVDINGDGLEDNAWEFIADNGDTVVYSVLVDDRVVMSERNNVSRNGVIERLGRPYIQRDVDLTSASAADKARALITRTGPLATTEAVPACQGAVAEDGWQVVTSGGTSTLQKNFQVNAFVAKGNGTNTANRTFETLEFQQSRIASRASKWGAWFRYDLEIHPGPQFNWNGAMHTDGSLILNGRIEPYMVSSFNSCLYSRDSSEVTVGPAKDDFQGQVIVAKTTDNEYTNSTITVHVFDGLRRDPTRNNLTRNNDSVAQGSSRPSAVAMNPLLLFTQEKEAHINPTVWSRDPNWDNNRVKQRIDNAPVSRPFVDDLSRADDRWGPKPRYNSTYDLTAPAYQGLTIGDDIDPGLTDLTNKETGLDGYWERRAIASGLRLIVGQRLELGNTNGWNNNPTGVAAAAGDPLYPHNALKTENPDVTGRALEHLHRKSLQDNLAAVQSMAIYHYDASRTNGISMASDGRFPMACYALTAHPGTPQTIINSRTFRNYPNANTRLRTDFFTGNGTNGWEFKYHPDFDTAAEFRTQVLATRPLGAALRNLANFAGDPYGGAPSFKPEQEVGNRFIHPYPYQAMWGDFSSLRRIVDGGGLNSAAAFDDLSFADQSTVHTAACTLGMLAYNLDSDMAELAAFIGRPSQITESVMQSVSQRLGGALGNIMDCLDGSTRGVSNACSGTGGFNVTAFLTNRGDLDADGGVIWNDPTPPVIPSPCPAGTDAPGFQTACDAAEYFGSWTEDEWMALIRERGVIPGVNDPFVEQVRQFSRQVRQLSAYIRDRDLGFQPGRSRTAAIAYDAGAGSFINWNGTTGLTNPVPGILNGNRTVVLNTKCDPNIFQDLSARGRGGADNNVVLALVACAGLETAPVRHPSLYYLFPTNDHDHLGADYHAQPRTEEYIQEVAAYETYLDAKHRAEGKPAYTPVQYRVVGSSAINGLNQIAAVPKETNLSDWVVPHGSLANGNLTPNNISGRFEAFKIVVPIRDSGRFVNQLVDVAFLDKGIYNGRELLNTRVLDVDLFRLTTTRVAPGRDLWLSADRDKNAEGVFYAFREDAVREDEIVRPKQNAATTLSTCTALAPGTGNDTRIFAVETQPTCQVNIGLTAPQDPPLTDQLISLKPVDFVPDPQRRVHGFRLRTSQIVNNQLAPIDFSVGDATTPIRSVGMTFVSDNGTYIMGDFNPHSSDGSTAANRLLEEFTQTITDRDFTFNNFYRDRTTLNTTTFSSIGDNRDRWRPVEILSDAVYILSRNFIDGSVADTVVPPNNPSSYTNQPRPVPAAGTTLSNNWVQQNPADTSNASPLYVDRNGTYYVKTDPSSVPPGSVRFFAPGAFNTAATWTRIQDNKRLMQAVNTHVNAVFVAGISPSRPNQGYGGLHNMPRFLENWRDRRLNMQGSFIQLNFATANTAPYEQEAFEPGDIPRTAEPIAYYEAPNRRWGYDVGLLYVPPAPAARRFVQIGAPRSEYYREVPADDPYIVNLRCATRGGQRILSDLCPA